MLTNQTIKFKDLGDGEVFEFANRVLGVSELGPWTKVGKRVYMAADIEHRLNGFKLNVGSVNAPVIAATR